MTVSVLGAMRLTGSLVLDNDTGVFPLNPKVGTMHVKGETLYTYLTIAGVTNWFPLARLPERYVHVQSAPLQTWVVQHNLNNQDVWYQIQDSNGQITTPADFVKINDNTFNLVFTEPMQGKVLVLATGLDGNEQPGVTIANILDWPTAVSAAEVAHLDGVTSSIQTQLNTLTAGLANVQVGPISLSSLTDWPSAVSAVEVGYLDGVTSSIQIQLDAKQTAAQVDARIQQVVGTAPAALDTLGEIAAQLAADETAAAALTNTVSLKADKTYVDAGFAALNASNLTTGTVPTARLGTGTASASTYLRGDGTWATVSSSPTSLTGSGAVSYDGYTTGVFAGVNGSTSAPVLGLVNASAPANNRFNQFTVDASNGRLNFALINDVGATSSSWMYVDRSGNVATNVTITANAITLVGPVTATSFSGSGASLTSLNASNLSSGTVPTARLGTGTANSTTYLRGDGTWATVSGGGGTPGGADTQVQYNSSGSFAGSASFTFNSATGVVSATGFSGDGSALSALNASNLTTGTVGTARLGSGTANNTVFLRGDGTWATPTASATALSGTTSLTPSSATSGLYAYTSSAQPYIQYVASGAPTDQKMYDNYINKTDGSLNWRTLTDASGNGSNFIVVNRSGTTVTNITLTGTAITLTGAVTGTSFSGSGAGLTALNASNLASGTVAVARLGSGTPSASTYLRGDGAWVALTSTVSALNGTGAIATPSVTGSSVNAGLAAGSIPQVMFTNSAAPAGNRIWYDQVESTNGSREFWVLNDGNTSNARWMKVDRSALTITGITMTATNITLTGAVSGTSFSGVGTSLTALNASNLTSGTVATARLGTGTANSSSYLRGDGTWNSVTATGLNATNTGAAALVSTATTAVVAGVHSTFGSPSMWMVNSAAAADRKIYFDQVDSNGSRISYMVNDAQNAINAYMQVDRVGAAGASNITLTATTLTFGGNFVNSILPSTDNAKTLGGASNRWSVVYAGTGTINTSDANLKQDIAELDEVEKRVALRLKALIRKFRFKDSVAAKGDAARIHVGVIAQDVEGAFILEGLDPEHYGVFCKDTWIDDQGVEQTRLGVRHDELYAFIISIL